MQQFKGGFGYLPEGFSKIRSNRTYKTFTSNKISNRMKRKENHIGNFNHKIIDHLNYQTQIFGVYFIFTYSKVPDNHSATLIKFFSVDQIFGIHILQERFFEYLF